MDDITESIDDIDLLYKKRGPKKKLVKKPTSQLFKLSDSDIDSNSDEEEIAAVGMSVSGKYKRKNTLNKPWIEKYRPVDVESLVLEEGTKNKIRKIIEAKSMPNIIITGPPGVGKTTSIWCIAKNLLGSSYREAVLELNASDDRGVKTAQEVIEYFCKKKVNNESGCAQHKIVLLDEADNMTPKAQQTISSLMETFVNSTRFAFTCNNSSKIIEAIQSRCIIFRYVRLTNQQLIDRLTHICTVEKMNYTVDGLMSIITISQGDLRKAINNLQLTYNGYTDIVPDNVYKLCDRPYPMVITNIFKSCYKNDIKSALLYLDELRSNGYSSSDISQSMMDTLKDIGNDVFDEGTKIRYMNEIGQTCLVISKGMNTQLQLSGSIAALCKKIEK